MYKYQEVCLMFNHVGLSASIVHNIPFEPKMNKKLELLNVLSSAADKAEMELKENFPEEKAMPVIIKLRRLIEDIHYEEHNKSIAIFISPLTEKVYYFTYKNFLENYYPDTF
jgi:hypothetical protein